MIRPRVYQLGIRRAVQQSRLDYIANANQIAEFIVSLRWIQPRRVMKANPAAG